MKKVITAFTVFNFFLSGLICLKKHFVLFCYMPASHLTQCLLQPSKSFLWKCLFKFSPQLLMKRTWSVWSARVQERYGTCSTAPAVASTTMVTAWIHLWRTRPLWGLVGSAPTVKFAKLAGESREGCSSWNPYTPVKAITVIPYAGSYVNCSPLTICSPHLRGCLGWSNVAHKMVLILIVITH